MKAHHPGALPALPHALHRLLLTALCISSCDQVILDDTHSGVSWDGPATLTVTITPEESGIVTVDPEKAEYRETTTVALTAQASTGYRFARWEGDVTGSDNPASLVVNRDRAVTAVFARSSWTIAVYMNADNELEANAIQDLNELEAGALNPDSVTVLALLDRAPGHDTSNGDWTDTRLYRVRADANGLDGTIVSERLAASELGLAGDTAVELNLGDPFTLANLLSYAARAFPADHVALVVWGHGTGWRFPAEGSCFRSLSGIRAMGFDDSSEGDPLCTAELAGALEGQAVDIVGLDVCLGAMLEVAYELRDRAAVLIASEELTAPDGWEYNRVLELLASSGLSLDDFATCVIDAFAEQYATSAGSTISAIDLAKVEAVSVALNAFSDALFAAASTNNERLELRERLFTTVEDFYVTPGDLNLDLADLAAQVREAYEWADAEADALEAAVSAAVLREWHHAQGNPRAAGLAVHYVPLNASGMPVGHDEAYMRGSVVSSPLAFVADSTWVPDLGSETGLLYRLWYEVME